MLKERSKELVNIQETQPKEHIQAAGKDAQPLGNHPTSNEQSRSNSAKMPNHSGTSQGAPAPGPVKLHQHFCDALNFHGGLLCISKLVL